MKPGFEKFLAHFPEIELPITLNEEMQHTFSSQNKPLPLDLCTAFIPNVTDVSEFTEYVPCFQLKTNGAFYAVVYWQAVLLEYKYVLTTYSKYGNLISEKTLCGTRYDGKKIIQAIAIIDEYQTIHVVQGSNTPDSLHYDPQASIAVHFEILEDGKITRV